MRGSDYSSALTSAKPSVVRSPTSLPPYLSAFGHHGAASMVRIAPPAKALDEPMPASPEIS